MLIAVAGLAFVAHFSGRSPELPARSVDQRPRLMLLTTLPIIFPEQFGLAGGGSPALDALERRYSVEPIGVADASTLKGGGLLLMAHPLAQPAEVLVELDAWVRRGGRLLLLADPALEWHSERPLGDKLRPPPAFADTGLLAHWGLRLDAPDVRGPGKRSLAGKTVTAVSPGLLAGKCRIARDGFVAQCRVGRGSVSVIADSDFLDAEQVRDDSSVNLDALLRELAGLEQR